MRFRPIMALGLATFLLGSGVAEASNDNFYVTNLLRNAEDPTWSVTSAEQADYIFKTFSQELGVVLSHKYNYSGDSTGISGFDIAFELQNSYVDTDRGCPEGDVSRLCYDSVDNTWDPWRMMDGDHRLTMGKLYPVPGLRLRKGLPLSLEVGSALYFLSFSSQAAIQGFGRWSLHEGFDQGNLRLIPDTSLTVSYTQLLGNAEMDLGVLDWGFTFGWTLPVGGVLRSRVGQFSVYGGFGRSLITATPTEGTPEELSCLNGYTGRQNKAVSFDSQTLTSCEGSSVLYDRDFRPMKGFMGLRVINGIAQTGFGLEFAGVGVPTLSMRTGLIF